jgi:dihydrofolate reductase
MKLTIIAARAKNGVIGNKGALPWKLPLDLEHFKKTTIGSPIIMGRKTYESIGQPLPGRLNIVITKDQKVIEGVSKVPSLPDAINLAYMNHDEAFIIGGAALYQMAIPYAHNMIITEVLQDFEGDTYFPQFNASNWNVEHSFAPFFDNGILCSVARYERFRVDESAPVPSDREEFTEMDEFRAQMFVAIEGAWCRTHARERLRLLANKFSNNP